MTIQGYLWCWAVFLLTALGWYVDTSRLRTALRESSASTARCSAVVDSLLESTSHLRGVALRLQEDVSYRDCQISQLSSLTAEKYDAGKYTVESSRSGLTVEGIVYVRGSSEPLADFSYEIEGKCGCREPPPPGMDVI